MLPLLAALVLALSSPAAAPASPAAARAAAPSASPAPSARIAKIMARGDGASPQTAYKVSRVRDEYEIVRALGLEARSQSLVVRKKAYDVLEVVDPDDGKVRELWFDISRFYRAY